jgi:hypothetical protein
MLQGSDCGLGDVGEGDNAYEVLAPGVGMKKAPVMTPPRMIRLRGRLQKDMIDVDVMCSKLTR